MEGVIIKYNIISRAVEWTLSVMSWIDCFGKSKAGLMV